MGWVTNATPRPPLPPGKTRYPLYRSLGGPQGRSGQVRRVSLPSGFDPRTVQPVASRYTEWAIVVPSILCRYQQQKPGNAKLFYCIWGSGVSIAKRKRRWEAWIYVSLVPFCFGEVAAVLHPRAILIFERETLVATPLSHTATLSTGDILLLFTIAFCVWFTNKNPLLFKFGVICCHKTALHSL